MQQQMLTDKERERYRAEIRRCLGLLCPDTERGEPPELGQLCKWAHDWEAPDAELPRLAGDLRAEVAFRRAVGDEKYFSIRTPREKGMAYLMAVAGAARLIEADGLAMDRGMTQAAYRRYLNKAIVLIEGPCVCGPRGGSRSEHPEPDTRRTANEVSKGADVAGGVVEIKAAEKRPKRRAGKKGAAKTGTRKGFMPPTAEEVEAYCEEAGLAMDAKAFWLHYEENGWMRGENPMKNWRLAAQSWAKKREHFDRRGDVRGGNVRVGRPADVPRGEDHLADMRDYVPMKAGKAEA